MQRFKGMRWFLTVALVIGIGHVVGCAGPKLSAEQADAALQAVQQLHDEGQYALALEDLGDIRLDEASMEEAQVQALQDRMSNLLSKIEQARQAAHDDRVQKLDAILTEAEKLVAAEKYLDAQAKLAELDGYEDVMTDADEERAEAVRNAQVRKAQEHMDAGMASYDAGNYVAAREQLGAAEEMNADMGYWRNRRLNATLAKVTREINVRTGLYKDGVAAETAGELELARKLFAEAAEDDIQFDPEMDARARLNAVEAKIDEMAMDDEMVMDDEQDEGGAQAAEDEAMQARADAATKLLAEATTLTADGKYAEAKARLVQLEADYDDVLTDEQEDAVEELNEAREDAAEDLVDRGVAQYENGQLLEAQKTLGQAETMQDDLGWGARRRLRSTLKKVTKELDSAQIDYEKGKAAFDAGEMELARKHLEPIKGHVALTADQRTSVDDMLGKIAQADEKIEADREAAVAHYEAGMAAYKTGDYIAAIPELEAAQAVSASLDKRDARRLADALEDARKTVEGLMAIWNEALAAEQAGDLQVASDKLAVLAKTDVAFMEGAAEKVAQKMTDVETKLAVKGAAEARKMLEEAQARAARAAAVREVQQQISDSWDAFMADWKAEAFKDAKEDLNRTATLLNDELVKDLAALDGTRAKVNAYSAAIDDKIAIAETLASAVDLMETDLKRADEMARSAQLAAEVDGPRGLLSLTSRQEAQVQAITAAADRKFGTSRGLRRPQYDRALNLASLYLEGGRLSKAEKMAQLVATADIALTTNRERAVAGDIMDAAKARADEQKVDLALILGSFDSAAKALEERRFEDALSITSQALPTANSEAHLDVPHLMTVANKVVSFLTTDFANALAAARTDTAGVAKGALAAAQNAAADQRARISVAGAPSRDEVADLSALADKLEAATRAGDLAAATRLQADYYARQAAIDLRMGKLQDALKALTETDEATGQAITENHGRVLETAQALAAAEEKLDEVVADLEAGNLEDAVAKLQAVAPAARTSRYIEVRAEALQAVVEPVRMFLAERRALDAKVEAEVEKAKASLANLQDREAAWAAYYEGLRTFLTDDVEQGRKALVEVTGEHKTGLISKEIAHIDDLLGRAKEPVLAAVDAKLDAASKSIAMRHYVTASMLLDEAEEMEGMGMSPRRMDRLHDLRRAVANAEENAGALYEKAIEARDDNDPAEVARILGELKSQYKHTRVVQSNL